WNASHKNSNYRRRHECPILMPPGLVKTLGVPLGADFSRIASRDKHEIDDRERETHRPPKGSEAQSARARSDGVGGQCILRRKGRIKHHRKNRDASTCQYAHEQKIPASESPALAP